MEQQQIKRWKQVAKGMCFHLWENTTQKRKERLWKEVESFIDEVSEYDIKGWEDEHYLCDWCPEFFESYDYHWARNGAYKDNTADQFHFFEMLTCVCRGSIGLITASGGMVWGFEVGDLKRVFDGEFPQWILDQYETLTNETPETNGILI